MGGRATAEGASQEGRLTGGRQVLWYLVAAVSYVGAGMFEKGLLTWLVGPAWLVAVIWFGPLAVDRLRRLLRVEPP